MLTPYQRLYNWVYIILCKELILTCFWGSISQNIILEVSTGSLLTMLRIQMWFCVPLSVFLFIEIIASFKNFTFEMWIFCFSQKVGIVGQCHLLSCNMAVSWEPRSLTSLLMGPGPARPLEAWGFAALFHWLNNATATYRHVSYLCFSSP
jgi:hypothetical protein